jgi:predicted ATPase/signal transduction histidine kinase
MEVQMEADAVPPSPETPVPAEIVHESGRTRITRLALPGGTVIRKQPLGPDAERRVRHEVAMLQRLRGATGVAQLAGAPRYPGSVVLADAGAASLAGAAKPLAADELTGLAVGLGRAVAEMHRRGVMHRDITPANVVLSGDGVPCLVDFGLASSFAEIRPQFTHHSEIVGTLAYLAPEQTGRTGRPVDQRADLYALGATLYELATGEPPFGTGDPLRLIHDHLARVPVPPAEANQALPAGLSQIILHLLEKEPDNRYQTADGLVYDLERWQKARPAAAVFRAGEHDVPVRLLPPSRLIGRDDEVAVLEAAFAGALSGECRGVLVAGAPGVGKTALIDQLRPVVTGSDGWFMAGKFDAYRRDLEFDAGYQAFRALGRLLLAEPEDELAQLRERIVAAVGANAGLLAAVLPEFAVLLGAAPDAGDPLTARARMHRATAAALGAVASRKRPVVVFLDDLQWAGRTPLGLVDLMLSEEPIDGLLLVGAYREGDVDAAHPLAAPLSRWRGQPGVRHLHLGNLPEPSLTTMVAEMLRVDRGAAEGLAGVIEPYSRGNPYETVELLNALRHDSLLTATAAGWRWDQAAVRAHLGRFEVAGLLAARAAALPEKSRKLAEAMACLGGRAELTLLQAATGEPADAVDQALAPALEEGLLVDEPGAHPAVEFRHDRIREAILGGLGPEQQPALQLAMARRLAGVPALFAVAAEQYLPAVGAVSDAAERSQVVRLLRRAAGQATLTGDHALVHALLTAALALVGPGETGTLAEVHTGRHAALYCLGQLAEADEEYRTIERLCPAVLDRADATTVQVCSVTHRTRYAEAIGLGRQALRELGITVPAADQLAAEVDRQFGSWYQWLDRTEAADDLARPDLTDPTMLAASGLINATLTAAYFIGDPALVTWLGMEALRICLEHGPAPALISPVANTAFGALLRGDYAAGYRAARRILALGEARGYEPGTSQARMIFAICSCWAEPTENMVHAGQRAREGLIAGGDLAYASYTYFASVPGMLDCAPSLDRYLAEAEAGLAFVRRTGNEHLEQVLGTYRWLACVLLGDAAAATAEAVSADRYAGNLEAFFAAHVIQAAAAAIFGDQAGLDRHTAAAMPLVPLIPGPYSNAVARLLRGLAVAGKARSADAEGRGGLLTELDEVTRWLAERAADAPDNFLHLLRLLEAERAWAAGDFRAAALAFDAARREAAQRQRPWHRALIAERVARFYLAHGLEQTGYDLLSQARQEYLAWGATAKVSQLDWAYPALRTPAEAIAGDNGQSGDLPRDRTAITTGTIDLLGIVSASQALSSETSVGRLHARVAEVLSAMTGATGVHLLLWSEDRHGWFLPAPDADGSTVPISGTGHDRAAPMSVLRYAQRTRKPLVVTDAARDDRFARDPYFADVDCCSLLTVPILSRGTLRAVLLLENRLLAGAFTASRLDAVKLVAGQLAVSLDNTQLYAGFRQIADEQAALRGVATLVAQAVPPEAVFAAVAAEAGRLLGVDAAMSIRYDPQDSVTVVGAWTSTGVAAPIPVGSQLPLGGHNATTLVFQTGQTVRVDYADMSGAIGDAAARGGWERSSVGVPIRVEGRLWGVIIVAMTREELLPADAEARLAGFTELVATAIANAQARTDLRGVAEQQAALRRVATLVANGAAPEEVFAAVTDEFARLVPVDVAGMARFEPDGTIFYVSSWGKGVDFIPVGSRWTVDGTNIVTDIVKTGRSARVESQAGATGLIADLVREIGVRSLVGTSVVVEGRVWGVIGAGSTLEEPLPPDAEARLASFTELVATAIANAESRAALARVAEEQAALGRVATLVARAAPPEEAFAAVTAEAGRLLAADVAILSRYDADGTQMVLGTWAGTGGQSAAVGTRVTLAGQNLATLVFHTAQPARIDDYADASGPGVYFAHESGLGAGVGVPINVEGRLWGVMTVASAREPLPADTEARLARFTDLAATAIANAHAQAEVAASRARIVAAADETRRRIERDLHDGVQQRLVTQALMLSGIRDRVPPDVRAEVDEVRDDLAATRQELRNLCQGVHPAILVEAGLGAAIRALARRSPLPVRVQLRAGGKLPGSCEITAYYVAAEAFTNAAKHANASAVDILIEEGGGTLTVQVRDDGAGGADAGRGTGLTGLRDRVEAVGGSMTLDSTPGAGTVLTVLLPVTADDR